MHELLNEASAQTPPYSVYSHHAIRLICCLICKHQVDSDDEDDETMLNAALRAIPQQQLLQPEPEQQQATAMM
jgi:hypothetical protein